MSQKEDENGCEDDYEEEDCPHDSVELISPEVVRDSVEEYVIVKYTQYCNSCDKIIGTERHKFKFVSVLT